MANSALVGPVETDRRERIGEAVRRALPREDLGDAQDDRRLQAGSPLANSPAISATSSGGVTSSAIEVEQPGMAALLLGEALLRAVAGQRARSRGRRDSCDVLSAVGRAGIDHDDVIAESADSGYGAPDAVGSSRAMMKIESGGTQVSTGKAGPVG
jgi:hypothetical protein